MLKGKVKWFNDQKGYGFIQTDAGQDVFVHHSEIVGDGYRTLKEGDLVELTAEKTARGFKALNVIRSSAGLPSGRRPVSLRKDRPMKRAVALTVAVSLVLVLCSQSQAGIIDYDRRHGLQKIEGTVMAVDRRAGEITVRSKTSGKAQAYRVSPELLTGVPEGGQVLLKYQRKTNTVVSVNVKKD